MTKTTVDSAMLKDVLLLAIRGTRREKYGTCEDFCKECGAGWKSHHDECPVYHAQQLLKEIGDE